jgi:hypothetical protein
LHDCTVSGLGVEREDDAAAGKVGAHHLLHADAEGGFEMVEALVHAVADGAVGEERGEAAFAAIQHRAMAADIEIRLVLAGHARVGQVLRCGATAYGHVRRMERVAPERVVGGGDFRFEIAREGGGEDGVTDLRATLAKVLHVACVETLEDVANRHVQSGLTQEVTIRLRRDGEAVGHFDAFGRQLAIHLAQRSVLPADQRHIIHADVGEPFDESAGCGGFRRCRLRAEEWLCLRGLWFCGHGQWPFVS